MSTANSQNQPALPPLPLQIRVVVSNPQYGQVPEPLIYFWALGPLHPDDTSDTEKILPLTFFNDDEISFRVILERVFSEGEDGEPRTLNRWSEIFVGTVIEDNHIVQLRYIGDDSEKLAITVAGLYRLTVSKNFRSHSPQFRDTMIEGSYEFRVRKPRGRD